MKMAKASDADLTMAMELASALESIERYRTFPQVLRPDPDDPAPFDIDNDEHCREALEHILRLVGSASLMRVVFGMTVLLDPRNEIVDPAADTLERHPEYTKAVPSADAVDAERWRQIAKMVGEAESLTFTLASGGGWTFHFTGRSFTASIDASRAPTKQENGNG